jgi:hypothetical protein
LDAVISFLIAEEERSIRRSTLEKLGLPGTEVARVAILRAGLNLRIKYSRGSRSQMPVSKPPAARRKP